jgi:putative redox protein
MITARNGIPNYQTTFTDGIRSAISDTTLKSGGSDQGFHPHDLLEAAIATCMNMTVRIYAASNQIPLTGVVTRVTLDKSNPVEAVFRSEVELEGDLTEEQRAKLHRVAAGCPVRRTLMRTIRFAE